MKDLPIEHKILFMEACCPRQVILSDDAIDKIKDSEGWTPLEILAKRIEDCNTLPDRPNEERIPLSWMKKRYPWYNFEGVLEVDHALVKKVLNTPKSVLFIKDLFQDPYKGDSYGFS